MTDLLKLRDEIDKIDNQIVDLFEKRMEIVESVANYKISTGKPVLDRSREKSKLNNLSCKATTDFTRTGIVELFEHIMAISRKKQYHLLNRHGMVEEPDFETVTSLGTKDVRVVFQGVEGAYSQQAMNRYFGFNCQSYNVETWKDAMEAIANGDADYAVLPLENSSAGIVSENYDLLMEYNNYIVGEQIIRINHVLLGLPEAELSELREVYSHPQALMQCNEYLHEHGTWEKEALQNTAVAALKVKEDKDPSQAAGFNAFSQYLLKTF